MVIISNEMLIEIIKLFFFPYNCLSRVYLNYMMNEQITIIIFCLDGSEMFTRIIKLVWSGNLIFLVGKKTGQLAIT
jgi:hypothetical protein